MSNRYLGGIVSIGRDGLKTPPTIVEYLVVAGGMGRSIRTDGNGNGTGGGGAGGLLNNIWYVTIGTTYTVTIGAGGSYGASGDNSVFGTSANNVTASAGASQAGEGGGSGGANPQGGTNGQGFQGGTDQGGCAGGGAGAGSRGGIAVTNLFGGNGGLGVVSCITGTPVIYASGGGGGTGDGGGSAPQGGLTSSGNNFGSRPSYNRLSFYAGSGIANSGEGGGGPGGGDNTYTVGARYGGKGGSGIVVLRYPSYFAEAKSTTGSPDTYITGGFRVYRFNASGTITF
jgi:hypothetical protein